ncbi:MAG TPA: cyclic nucleotide-binding domain-containing protein [Bauldia sp.]|nr:cyclic nucleotide-binding domain-containing protein [Bauldia sp.]
MTDVRAILKSTPFFAEVLDDKELVLLADHARTREIAGGERLVEEDDRGHSMFVVVAGDFTVTVHGEEEPLARLGSGAIVGEMSLLTGEPRSATVTAVSPGTVLQIDKDALANVLWMAPGLVDRFVEMLFRRQRELDRLAGGAAWGMMRPGKAELAARIHGFFETTA